MLAVRQAGAVLCARAGVAVLLVLYLIVAAAERSFWRSSRPSAHRAREVQR